MGKYTKKLREKTDEELIEIFYSITTYTGEYIDDFLTELDIRRMLWDMKKLLNEKDLITLKNKLESISTSKYLSLIKHELEIRGSERTKSQQKYTKTENKTSNYGTYSSLIGIALLGSFLMRKCNEIKPTQNFNDKITVPTVNPTFGLPQDTPSYNNFDSYNYYTPENLNLNMPELNTGKISIIKLPRTDSNQMKINQKYLQDYNTQDKINMSEELSLPNGLPENSKFKRSDFSKNPTIYNPNLKYKNPTFKIPLVKSENHLNPGFQKMLDTITNKKD